MEAFRDGKDVNVTAVLDSDGKISQLNAQLNTEGGKVWGIVKGLSTEKINMYSGSSTVSYYFADGVEATLDGDATTVSKLDKLNDNGTEFTATLYLNSQGKVTRIAAELQDKTAGTISNITEDYIEIKTEYGKDYKYFLDDNAVVQFTGSSKNDIKSLMDVYEKGKTSVKLEFNKSNLVSKIIAYTNWSDFETVKGDIENAKSDSVTIDGKKYSMDSTTTVYIDGEQAVYYDVYTNYRNGVEMDVTATITDGFAKKLDITITGATGMINGMENGYISIKSGASTKRYAVAKSEDLIIRINGETKNFFFSDLYDRWNNQKLNYRVSLKFGNGKVVRITAEEI